ncbi:MAG TPA: GNAT family N-acetyltransferase [Candidatus Saccharimonadales bacterium]|nr:GNAT family N-acetyltransferase [Candidatus Saccharimonadales bacterium]
MDITFRDYTDSDKPQLIQLSKKLSKFGKILDPMKRIINAPGFAEMDVDETLNNVKKYQGKILLAEDNKKIIGFIIGVTWEQSKKNELEIGKHVLGEVVDLFIEEAYRGQGIGTKMLTMMEEYFKEKGCDSMWVSMFAPNKNAHTIYEKFGFADRSIGMLKNI